MPTTKNDHIYKITAEVTSIHLDGTITINFQRPVVGICTSVQIPQDDFSLGDVIEFEIGNIWSTEEWKEKSAIVEGEIVSVT